MIHSTPLYWAQSIFNSVYDELRDCVLAWGLPDDSSSGLLACFSNLDATADFLGKQITYREYYEQCVFVVDFDKAIASKIRHDMPCKYHGYVSKYAIASFECGEIDEIDHWYTSKEYQELNQEEQREYAYYRWNNWFEDYQIYSELKQKIEYLKEWFMETIRYSDEYTWEELEYTPIRLIVCRS